MTLPSVQIVGRAEVMSGPQKTKIGLLDARRGWRTSRDVATVLSVSFWFVGCAHGSPCARPGETVAPVRTTPSASVESFGQSERPPPASGDRAQTRARPQSSGGYLPAPEWGAYFENEGLKGVAVVWQPQQSAPRCHGEALCERGFIPASTFKIPNTVIGLETGVIPDAAFTLKWDGQTRWLQAWNRDHDLRSAFRNSVVWYYQEVARRIGEARMKAWLERLGYGNRDIRGGQDLFWLNGAIRITALEQVAFLRRLVEGELPISERTLGILKEISTLASGSGWSVHGKTGGYQPPEVPWDREHPTAGWVVGWVERERELTYFATLVLDPPATVNLGDARWRVTDALLRGEGLIPKDAKALPW